MEAKKILFATVPLEGHFNPLTGLAMHLKSLGHDVRWYTGNIFQEKLSKMKVFHYPFQKALEVTQYNIDKVFPERKKHRSTISKLRFDIKNYFINRTPEYFEDIKDINREFPFDLLISDSAFGASPVVKEKLHKKSMVVGITPLVESDKDLPPVGMGLTPSNSFFGKRKQDLLHFVADKVLFKEAVDEVNKIFKSYGMQPRRSNVFDMLVRDADIFFQSGVPGFEYKRSHLGKNIRYAGPLLPYQTRQVKPFNHYEKLAGYQKVILVTQGTLERDPEKIIVPTLEAFKNDPHHLVIATTGGSKTEELRKRYPQKNIHIEDFIAFDDIMPHVHVYVTNGGYGGALLSIQHQVPMVVAGVHEGKIEIAARVGYFKLGINLKTETPDLNQIKEAVKEVLSNPSYQKRVTEASKEFSYYHPAALCEKYVTELCDDTSKAAVVMDFSSIA